ASVDHAVPAEDRITDEGGGFEADPSLPPQRRPCAGGAEGWTLHADLVTLMSASDGFALHPFDKARVDSQPVRAVTIQDGSVVVDERPDPAPGKGEVLVRVRAAGLNGADMLQKRGAYPAPPGSP